MSEKNNSGPAFPIGSGDMRDPQGMSLRDYFAAKAMQGILSNLGPSKEIVLNGKIISVSQLAYMYADAMLKARDE